MTAFKAVLVRCENDHYEATTADSWDAITGAVMNLGVLWQERCARCKAILRLVKTVTITPRVG